jgi:RimJ/RimL family protein N-acetyltransferase
MILLSPRLELRPSRPEDLGDLVSIYLQQELLARWLPPPKRDPDLAASRVSGFLIPSDSSNQQIWTVCDASDGAILGLIDISLEPDQVDEAFIGFMLGNGVGSDGRDIEALAAIIHHALFSGHKTLWTKLGLGVRRAEALVFGLGFKVEAHLRGEADRERERRDFRLYRLDL